MPHFEFYELSPEAKRDAARLRSQIAGNEMLLGLYRLEALLRKANFNSNEPRVPAGSSDGGQWTSDGSSANAAQGDKRTRNWLAPEKAPSNVVQVTAPGKPIPFLYRG